MLVERNQYLNLKVSSEYPDILCKNRIWQTKQIFIPKKEILLLQGK